MSDENSADKVERRAVTIQCPDTEQHVSSRELLGEQQCLSIVHNNEFYQLRLTRSGKLILTK